MMTAIVLIIMFALLVSVHEGGHFVVAKLSGMYVEEFSIGVGPKIVSKRFGETRYSLRVLPLGGYVRIIGDDESEEDRSKIDIPTNLPDERKYYNIAKWKRALFMAAGSIMNLLTAVIIFAIMYMIVGVAIPIENPDAVISAVAENSPASEAGILPGDHVISANGNTIENWADLHDMIQSTSDGDAVHLEVERVNDLGIITHIPDITVYPKYNKETGKMLMGIYQTAYTRESVGPLKGLLLGTEATYNMTIAMIDIFKQIFTGQIDITSKEQGLTGPIGIVKIVNDATHEGIMYVCNLTALLSINLAVVNLLPIPSLDGSKLMFLLIEAIRGKRVSPEKEGLVHLIGYALLMLLLIFITYQDIIRFILN